MKYFLLLGGFSGFVLVFSASIAAGNPATNALLKGATGCLVGAFLLRGLHFVFMVSVRGHIDIRAAEGRRDAEKAAAGNQIVQ